MLLTGCAAAPIPTPASTEPSSGTPAASPTPTPPVEPTPTPIRTPRPQSATDLLDCDGPVSASGGTAFDFGPEGFGDSPEEAFASWVQLTGFGGVPRSGYRALGDVGGRSVWVYESEGRTKVVVIISSRFSAMVNGAPFTIDELRMCDVSEFGAGVELGPGVRAWTHETTGELITDSIGSSTCGWEGSRILYVPAADGIGHTYLRDPLGVFPPAGRLADYAEGVALPADAAFSGYRSSDGHALWLTAENHAGYVVGPEGVVERWPRAINAPSCH